MARILPSNTRALRLYGLPWQFPGWVANDPQSGAHNDSGSPFDHPEQTTRYVMEWVKGAKSEYNLHIVRRTIPVRSCLLEAQAPAAVVRGQDYLGVWNEAPYDAGYVKLLRKALDASGFTDTLIVGHDAGLELLTPSPSLFLCLVLTGSVWSNQAPTSALPCWPTRS